jgi:hypothetical protein
MPKVSPPRTTTKPQPKRIAPEDPCPFHVGHKWGKCLDTAKNPDREEILQELKAKRETTKTRNASPILAMVLLLNGKTILLLMTTESPAMEMKIPLALC